MKNPKVSVVMPVYNGEKYLKEAINSILNQTYKDFEFLILDDNSQDNTVDIIKSYPDERIKLFMHNEKKGIAALLNDGFEIAKGEYIARMDCDDISLPKRLEKQVSFMDKNQQIGVCGTWARLIGIKRREKFVKHAVDHNNIIISMLFGNLSFVHPSVIMRKKIFIENNLFYKNIIAAEDYDLWERTHKFTQFANISKCLMKYRWSIKGSTYNEVDRIASRNIQKRLLEELVDNIEEEEWMVHCAVVDLSYNFSKEFLFLVDKWFNKLIFLNQKKRIFEHQALCNTLALKWIIICQKYQLFTLIKFRSLWTTHFKYINLISCERRLSIVTLAFGKMFRNLMKSNYTGA